MEYKECNKCKFWVAVKTKRCPNCGDVYPTRTRRTQKASTQRIFIISGTGFVFSVLLFLPEANGVIYFVVMALAWIIIGTVADLIYVAYLTVLKVKSLKQPYLIKDEQKISQRQQKLDEKKREIQEAMEQIDEALQLVEKPTERFEIAKRTLQNALEAITQQHNEYSVKLWEIALIRWYNALKPLTILWESYFTTSNKTPTRHQYDVYLGDLQNIHRHGQALLNKIQRMMISSTKEKLHDYSIQLYDALEAINKLVAEVVERQAAFIVQDTVKDVSFIQQSSSPEHPILKSTIEQLGYLDTLLPDLDTFSSEIEKLEEEYFRLEAEKEVENKF